MTDNDITRKQYDEKYGKDSYYWTVRPSGTCFHVLRLMPPEEPLRLLDVGCGEGRNAVFFARNGYEVDAFDISGRGLEKAERLAMEAGVNLRLFQADINSFRLEETYDIIFSTGVLHSCDPPLRTELFDNYKDFTSNGGLNVFSVFVKKPFIPPAPDGDANAHPWLSGELLSLYHDWKIEWSEEDIFDCNSSGVPHRHAVNRIAARKVTS